MATALHKTKTMDFKNMAIQCQQLKDNAGLAVDITELTALQGVEWSALDGAIAGTVVVSKAVIVDANKDVSAFRTLGLLNLDAGSSGAAGTVDIFPSTALKGKIALTAADSAGDFTLTIVNASIAAARTYTLPDAGAAASFVMTEGTATINGAKTFGTAPDAPVGGYKADGVTMGQLAWYDITVAASVLDSAGTQDVIAGVAGDQYKIRDIVLVGGGTNYGAGGDRLIDLTDGTTVWTTIANADIETAPSASLKWGNAKVPLLTGTSDTKSVAGQAIRFVYSGGGTDHSVTGSIVFAVLLEKTD